MLMISVDEVMGILEEYAVCAPDEEKNLIQRINQASMFIDNIGTVSKWVRVEDRLPEKHGWYLVARKKTYPTDSGMQVCFFCHGRFMVDKKIKITHWRPLPEYPESEEKSEI